MTVQDKPKFYTLENENGYKAVISDYGARLCSFEAIDKDKNKRDVVLGYNNADDLLNGNSYFGATIGRFANRIANGRFSLNGVEYKLDQNNGPNALHGGKMGYDRIFWKANQIDNKIILKHLDPHMHEGYPGNVEISVIYELNSQNELSVKYLASSDKDTVINLTHHSFFNLKGAGNGDILEHKLLINADSITPLNEFQIPTGEFMNVENTPFDFRSFKKIGERIDSDHQQLKFGFGYDHNWVLNEEGTNIKYAASLAEFESGIRVDVYTSEPGLQIYTGNFLDGSDIGREGIPYQRRTAVCLETQHFPDSPNKEHFPSTVLRAGDVFESVTVYRFS